MEMEIEKEKEIDKENNNMIKGSKMTMKFLNYFSCLICKEIRNFPYYLKCNHIYCENCVSYFNVIQENGSIICPLCYVVTKKEEILPEFEMKLFITDLKSSNDEQFMNKYKYKLDFNNESDFRDIVLFLIRFFSIENKCTNNNKRKKVNKRGYLELTRDNYFSNNNDNNEKKDYRCKPLLKAC